MEGYFKIGELSRLYGIGTDTIRYYEELGLIQPERGPNGYRLYSMKEIWRMNVIRDLRGLGFSMERIRDYLEGRSVEVTISLLEQEQAAIEEQLASLGRLRGNVERRLSALKAAQTKPVGVVERAHYPERPCHEILQAFTSDEEMDVLLKRLLNRIQNRLYIIGNTQIGCRMSEKAVAKGDFHCYGSVFIIDDEAQGTNGAIAAGDFLTLRYRGSSLQSNTQVGKLYAFAKKHGLALTGEIIELILVDIHEASDYSEHITEVQARVVPV